MSSSCHVALGATPCAAHDRVGDEVIAAVYRRSND